MRHSLILTSVPICQLCLPPHGQTESWGGTANLVRRGRVHHSVPVPDHIHLESTAVQAALPTNRCFPCRIPCAFPPIDRIGTDGVFGGRLRVVMPGYLKAKHVHWISRLSTRLGKSYVIMSKRTVCSLDLRTQPPYHTAPWFLPMSWTS